MLYLTLFFSIPTTTTFRTSHTKTHKNTHTVVVVIKQKKRMSSSSSSAFLNFLSFTAQIPLNEGEDLRSAEAKGFTKTKLSSTEDLKPSFDGSKCFSYALTVPKGTTHVGVMATSFSGRALKINDVNGNMSVVELISEAKNTIKVTLHNNEGEVETSYEIQVNVSEEAAKDGEVVMKEKEVPKDTKAVHAHSHDGVPCDKDHSKDGEHTGHGHSHHAHGHGEEKKEEHGHGHHGHSHDGVPCDKDHSKDGEHTGHGHSHHAHGHGEEKKEEHGHGHHGHSHDGVPCDKDHSKDGEHTVTRF